MISRDLTNRMTNRMTMRLTKMKTKKQKMRKMRNSSNTKMERRMNLGIGLKEPVSRDKKLNNYNKEIRSLESEEADKEVVVVVGLNHIKIINIYMETMRIRVPTDHTITTTTLQPTATDPITTTTPLHERPHWFHRRSNIHDNTN